MKSMSKKICSMVGTLMISLVIASSLPLAIPKLLGYQTFNIVSGSMEPTYSVGTIVYVKEENPQWIAENEIIAFYANDSVIVHRVVENDRNQYQLRTKGDANAAEDFLPVEYANVIGRVRFSIAGFGNLVFLYASMTGKISLLAFLLAGAAFRLIADAGRERSLAGNLLDTIQILFCVCGILFLAAIFVLANGLLSYQQENAQYQELSRTLVQEKTKSPIQEQTEPEFVDECPITVDFDKLWQINPDIVGWIYCEDTVINYPICHGEDDIYYLSHAYDKSSKACGSIFMEAQNLKDCSDANMILYGHHMKNKTMFATLSNWKKQDYYETHPVMWLLTPEKSYKVILISGYYTEATSDTYTVFRHAGEQMQEYISKAIEKSKFEADISEIDFNFSGDENADQFIVLSTCEYTFENARFVLHGVLK